MVDIDQQQSQMTAIGIGRLSKSSQFFVKGFSISDPRQKINQGLAFGTVEFLPYTSSSSTYVNSLKIDCFLYEYYAQILMS
jgi:hypothetical protein